MLNRVVLMRNASGGSGRVLFGGTAPALRGGAWTGLAVAVVGICFAAACGGDDAPIGGGGGRCTAGQPIACSCPSGTATMVTCGSNGAAVCPPCTAAMPITPGPSPNNTGGAAAPMVMTPTMTGGMSAPPVVMMAG